MPVENVVTARPQAGQIQPSKPVPPPTNQAGFNLPNAHNFVYIAHPHRWDIYQTDQGQELLPFVAKLEMQPGIAGVRSVEGHPDGNASFALQAKKDKGWVEVPVNFACVAFGVKEEGYVNQWPGKNGKGRVCIEIWRRPYMVGDTVLFDRDEAGFHQFLRDVRDKLLPPIDKNVLKGQRGKFAAFLGHLSDGPTAAQRLSKDKIEEKLVVFEEVKPKKSKASKPSEPAEPTE